MRATRDLPDPAPASEEAGERATARKSWRAAVTALLFASLYSSIHRLWVPLGLRFTPLSESPFAQIDPAFLAGLFLWIRAHRNERLTTPDAALAGAIVAFGIAEVVAIAAGHYSGWLALSHGLSSVPMAFAAFALILHRERGPSLLWPWLGALALLLALSPRLMASPDDSLPRETSDRPAPAIPNASAPMITGREALTLCGAQSLNVRIAQGSSLPSALDLEPCGLRPSLLSAKEGHLRLKNSSSHAANLHFVVYHGIAHRMGWNLVLRAGASMDSPRIALRDGEIGLLYSDSSPSLGLAIVVSEPIAELELRATRSPLDLKAGPP